MADELRARADAGDPLAACRLVAEADHCDQMQEVVGHLRQSMKQIERVAADQPERNRVSDDMRQRMRDTLDAREQALAHCADVASPTAAERVRYARQAALAGHLPSMRHYAIGHSFRMRDIMDVLPQLEVYRREAESIALRAAAAGDLESALALASAYLGDLPAGGPFRPLLEQTLPENPGQALAWAQAALAHPALASLPDTHPLRVRLDMVLSEATDRLPPDQRTPPPAAMAAGRSGPVRLSSGRGTPPFAGIARSECSDRSFLSP
ncbi:hypothetical protein LDO32_12275 [Luteimonas sp. Y-2-2-4F]|nr:hypothetical protein [Luteimonas sp. Y-2-2-4F]